MLRFSEQYVLMVELLVDVIEQFSLHHYRPQYDPCSTIEGRR